MDDTEEIKAVLEEMRTCQTEHYRWVREQDTAERFGRKYLAEVEYSNRLQEIQVRRYTWIGLGHFIGYLLIFGSLCYVGCHP